MLAAYDSRILALERLLRVAETELVAAEAQRDALACQLSATQDECASLSRDVLRLQLVRGELVLARLDDGAALEELALRHAVLREDAAVQAAVLRRVRDENRALRRDNDDLRWRLRLALRCGTPGRAGEKGFHVGGPRWGDDLLGWLRDGVLEEAACSCPTSHSGVSPTPSTPHGDPWPEMPSSDKHCPLSPPHTPVDGDAKARPESSAHTDSATWDGASSRNATSERGAADDEPDFSLIDPEHIALIEVAS